MLRRMFLIRGGLACLSLVLVAGAGCTPAAPARTAQTGNPAPEASAPSTQAAQPAAPTAPAAPNTPQQGGAPAAVAPEPTGQPAEGQAGQQATVGAPPGSSIPLTPPDGKWLTDEEGQQYFIVEIPRIEGHYMFEGENKVRLRGGLPLMLARYDDKTFYAKIFKVGPGDGVPVRNRKATPEEIEKAAAAYVVTLPTVDRLRFMPFDRGLPRGGQWRNGFDVADMNGDGQLDIVHGAARKGTTRPTIFLGDGRGNWRPWNEMRFVPADVQFDYGDAAAADFNGDGNMDIVVAMHVLGLRAFVGDGKGEFRLWSEGLDYEIPGEGNDDLGFSSRAIETVDWNRDKRPDVLAIGEGMRLKMSRDQQAPEIEQGASFGPVVYLNQGDGTWRRQDKGTAAGQIFGDALATGDFDGDGQTDFVTSASFVDRKDLVHLRREQLWEKAELDLRPRGFVTSVAADDFDRDGRDDIVLGYINNEHGVLRSGLDLFLARPGKGGLTWERRGLTAIEGRVGYYALGTGDVDGDKLRDLVALTGDGQALIFLGATQGLFARAEIPAGNPTEPGCRGYNLRMVDLDGDGRDEILANFAGEETSAQMIESLGQKETTRVCPSQGSIRAWKAVPAGAAAGEAR